MAAPAQIVYNAQRFSRHLSLHQPSTTTGAFLGKSAAYTARKRQIAEQDTAIAGVRKTCAMYTSHYQTVVQERCLQQLAGLNIKRDSLYGLLQRLERHGTRLTEFFDTVSASDARLQQARLLFEADNIREMIDVLRQETDLPAVGQADVWLRRKASLFYALAQAEAIADGGAYRTDTVAFYYRQALHCTDDARTLYELGVFFSDNNLEDSVQVYFSELLARADAPVLLRIKAALRLGDLLATKNDWADALPHYEQALDLAIVPDPAAAGLEDIVALVYDRLGFTYYSLYRLLEALTAYEQSFEWSETALTKHPDEAVCKHGLAVSYLQLAVTHREMTDYVQGRVFLEEADRYLQELIKVHPDNLQIKYDYAYLLEQMGIICAALSRPEQALQFFEKETEWCKAVCADYPNGIMFKCRQAAAQYYIGAQYYKRRDLEAALARFQTSDRMGQELYEVDPDEPRFKNILAVSGQMIGSCYIEWRKWEQALPYLEDAHSQMQAIVKAYPDNIWYQDNLISVCLKLGQTYRALKLQDKSLNTYEKAAELLGRLSEAYPEKTGYQTSLAYAFEQLGITHFSLRNHTAGQDYYEKIERLYGVLSRKYPANRDFKYQWALSFDRLSWMHNIYTKDKFREKNTCEKAQVLLSELLEASPGNKMYTQKLKAVEQHLAQL